jgi:hypothetical protein
VRSCARPWPTQQPLRFSGRHWPESRRNEAFLALGGTLARAGHPIEHAIRFHRAIYRTIWHSDANLEQAEREVRATYAKFASGESVTGFSSLTELVPTVAVVQALTWLGVQGPAADAPSVQIPLTDLGNAQRLVKRHGQDLRWCDDWKCWFAWDGRSPWGR